MGNPGHNNNYLNNNYLSNNYNSVSSISQSSHSHVCHVLQTQKKKIGKVTGLSKTRDGSVPGSLTVTASSAKIRASPENAEKERGMAGETHAYTELIKHNISYLDLIGERPYEAQLINEFTAIIIDAIMTKNPTVRIGKEDKPRELVRSVMQKLNYYDFEHALDQFKGVSERITKKKQYILTTLYNSKLENGAHYTNAVRADMYSAWKHDG